MTILFEVSVKVVVGCRHLFLLLRTSTSLGASPPDPERYWYPEGRTPPVHAGPRDLHAPRVCPPLFPTPPDAWTLLVQLIVTDWKKIGRSWNAGTEPNGEETVK